MTKYISSMSGRLRHSWLWVGRSKQQGEGHGGILESRAGRGWTLYGRKGILGPEVQGILYLFGQDRVERDRVRGGLQDKGGHGYTLHGNGGQTKEGFVGKRVKSEQGRVVNAANANYI